MKQTAACLVFLLTSLTLSAQNTDKVQTSTVLNLGTVADYSCPVAMVARQGLWEHTVKVENGQNLRDGIGQRISLTMVDVRAAKIVAATVKVLGLSGRSRVVNSSATPNGSPDASRVFPLTSFSAAKDGVTAELFAPGFTSVTSIQLISVTYADGSKWTNFKSNACRVIPDPLMLVAAQ